MWKYNYGYPNELYHHGVLGMKWGVHRASKRTYSGKEISDYRKRKMSEAPSKAESPRGANKGWYKNAPKSTLIRQMRQEDAENGRKAKEAAKQIKQQLKANQKARMHMTPDQEYESLKKYTKTEAWKKEYGNSKFHNEFGDEEARLATLRYLERVDFGRQYAEAMKKQ